MHDDLSNNAQPLRKNAVGTPADGKKMPSEAAGSNTTSYMTVGSDIPVTVKQTDYKNLRTGEDHRTTGAPAAMPNQPGPREGMGQFNDNSKLPAGSKPESFLGAEGSDQN